LAAKNTNACHRRSAERGERRASNYPNSPCGELDQGRACAYWFPFVECAKSSRFVCSMTLRMISPETIALVRDRTDILAVISESVPSLKRRGRSWVGLCPFHKEKTGSFHVNADRGFYHCFGCKESGSAIDFLMKHEGYTFPEAVRALAERAGIEIEETKNDAAFTEADRQRKAREDLYAVNALAAHWFEEQLRLHEHREYAIEELTKRGLTPGSDPKIDEVLQAFRIGYAPSGWDGLAQFLRTQGIRARRAPATTIAFAIV
jgi:DNA primase